MKPLHEHMGVYQAYHRNPTNVGIHFVMVPAIAWTILVWASLVPLGFDVGGEPFTLAFVITGAVLLWWLFLDLGLGIAAVVFFSLLLLSAMSFVDWLGAATAAWVAAIVFVVAWIGQFIGHGVYEKRRPALVDNALQALVGPFFLIAEVAFSLGMKQELRAKVLEEAELHRAE